MSFTGARRHPNNLTRRNLRRKGERGQAAEGSTRLRDGSGGGLRAADFSYDFVMTRPPLDTAQPDAAARGAPLSADEAAAMRVLRQFRIVFNAVKTHFRQVERDTGIGGAQLWALSEIRAMPGIGVNDLARALDVHQSTASNLVKGLMKRRLVVAERSERDRRIVLLSLLPEGATLLESAPAPFAGVLPGALAGLDLATLSRLEVDLASLITLIEADPTGAKVPLAEL